MKIKDNRVSDRVEFKGPRLVDRVVALLVARGYTNEMVNKEFAVGKSWLSNVKCGHVHSPNVDAVQHIYEELTGKPLVRDDE